VGLALHLVHNRQSAVRSRTDNKSPTLPGDVFRGGSGVWPEELRKGLDGFSCLLRMLPRPATTSYS
jgi:hypothetical protein